MAPLEPWERILIDAENYPQDVHFEINCTECHGGNPVDDMELAHIDLIPDPAADVEASCGQCHAELTVAEDSLHSTLAGYDTTLYGRSIPENHDQIEAMQANHCDSCHTTCGDCHISQPDSVGGGLLEGHVFVETPPMSQTCTACHGSRVKDEYYGTHEGLSADVHFRGRMACTDCHTANEMHGINSDAQHRYDGRQSPSCTSCHRSEVGERSEIVQHQLHGTELVSCQVCHSTSYTNCINCHVEQTDEGVAYFTVEEHFLGFYIGQNPLQNENRPYQYVPLRHVPIDIDSFSFYGEDLLPNFDARPTWVYTTPHNIQRNTPQTETCTACHGNDSIFLTPDKIATEEIIANQETVVESAPPLPEGYEEYLTDKSDDENTSGNQDDAFWGEENEGESSETNSDDAFWGEENVSKQ